MDVFKRMAQGTQTDFSVFSGKRKPKAPQKEEKISEAAIPLPIQEETAEVSESKEEEPKENKPAPIPVKEEPIEKETGKVIQFKKAENLNEEASIKLEAQLETAKSTLLPGFPIVRYLKNKCMADDAFAVLVNDEKKTLDKCFGYVEGEVKKALNGKNGWLDDNEVYAYAETYYMTDEAVFEKLAAEKEEAEKKRRADVEKRRKEQDEKPKKAAKEKKKNTTESKKAAVEKAKAEAENNGTVIPNAEPMTKAEPEVQEKEDPVMQQQICLDM